DYETENENGQDGRMPTSERRRIRRLEAGSGVRPMQPAILGQRTVNRCRYAKDYEHHAEPHPRVHGHAVEMVAHAMGHGQHWQVQSDSDRNRNAGSPEDWSAVADNRVVTRSRGHIAQSPRISG